MSGARRIFLAATGQNRGKTTVSLGLAALIAADGHRLGFLKPVGQRYLVIDGTRADEDAVLMKEVFDLPDALNDMSPVTLPRHFTTDYVMGRVTDDLASSVTRAATTLSQDKDVVLIEGTGHAGVGAVIGLSNARVAEMLEAPVVIVSEGGVGRPIDEIVLNHALFERHRVRVLGAVVNKVNVEANPDLPEVLSQGLAQHGIELLGCIPFSELLANPSLELITTHLAGDLLAGEATAGAIIGHVAIGAMRADHAVPYLRDRTLLITPGDREDMLDVALEAYRSGIEPGRRPRVTGIVLTGGFRPSDTWVDELRRAGLFTYLVETDTYRTAQDVQDILVKTHPTDTEKIATIIDLVGRSLDPETLLARV
ncbi:MAG TPA: AAA family ATPase [Candidatus Limnocylindria bacterium]|nr:AAA family ATPase [Candidatus Limnocylindria bacterium]